MLFPVFTMFLRCYCMLEDMLDVFFDLFPHNFLMRSIVPIAVGLERRIAGR
jgi:hypothetical protein